MTSNICTTFDASESILMNAFYFTPFCRDGIPDIFDFTPNFNFVSDLLV